jgi:hypothetical protein
VIDHCAIHGAKYSVRNVCGARNLKKVTSRVDHRGLGMNG